MKRIIWIFLFTPLFSGAQITAPDFTLTDINGVLRNLYNELNDGKTVVLDFFSIYCGTCITNTPALENIWQNYGYSGDSLWVWGIESFGSHDTSVQTFQNNYGSTFPLFSTANDDIVIYEYNITYTPQYFVICPDAGMKPYTVADIPAGIQNCKTTSAQQPLFSIPVTLNSDGECLVLVTTEEIANVQVELFTLMGVRTLVARTSSSGSNVIQTDELSGMFLYRLTGTDGIVIKTGKVVLQ